MKISKLFALVVLCASCKKDHESYQDLYSKADKKLTEIEDLVKKSSCNNLGNWQIDTIIDGQGRYKYFPVDNLIKSDYSKLKDAYVVLLDAAQKADTRPKLAYTIPPEVHFEVGCIDGHPKVLLTTDFTVEQVRERLNTGLTTLETFYTNPSCEGANNWSTLPIVKDCTLKYVLHQMGGDSENQASFNLKYRQYKALSSKLAQVDPNYVKCDNMLLAPQKDVTCENNIPLIKD
ncbi:hypothetical protein [Sphingobacterium sp.]|uniref:hypothetical protein n=1 Tax=Sphingobacterium sp. TaxID=341027 RepID=UPI0028AD1894|nr:hypothetical protein [Sphingobacterium sp.]